MSRDMTCKFEVGKEYLTRDGRKVRVYATDGHGDYPIHVAVFLKERGWAASVRCVDGRASQLRHYRYGGDLILPVKKVWVATWWRADVGLTWSDVFKSKAMALEWVGDRTLISLVEVEVPENVSK